ncbi:MAG: hypothetical protein CK425_06590 [Parachlamydia sp.]|nr:MAG: hypothetical protein CK425_06590 [Parachlamydia sp.]
MTQHAIAIIGGGFSGLSVLAHLISQATAPFSVYLIERSKDFAKGVAYSTSSMAHPLNVRAKAMGVFNDQPEHFWEWVEQNKQHPLLTTLTLNPDAFLPRLVYGLYLEDLYQAIQKEAARKQIKIALVSDEALDATRLSSGKLLLQLRTGNMPAVDFLVLALGAPPAKRLSFESAELLKHPNYIANPWNPPQHSILRDKAVLENQKVLIIGSGLTTVDTISSLAERHISGEIICISPRGTFPQIHQKNSPKKALPAFCLEDLPKTSLKLLKAIRSEILAAKDWREVIDALRTCTQALWQRLPIDEQRRFLAHLFSFWNNHRHRMAPACALTIERLKQEGKFSMKSGRVVHIEPISSDQLQATIKTHAETYTLLVEYVIKCTGPEYAVKHQHNPLLDHLHQKQLIEWDPLGLGLAVTEECAVKGLATGQIYALGALLFGAKFETTAVPDIREEASTIATTLLKKFKGLRC